MLCWLCCSNMRAVWFTADNDALSLSGVGRSGTFRLQWCDDAMLHTASQGCGGVAKLRVPSASRHRCWAAAAAVWPCSDLKRRQRGNVLHVLYIVETFCTCFIPCICCHTEVPCQPCGFADACAVLHMREYRRLDAAITCAATGDFAQLLDVYVGVEVCVCYSHIHSMAQWAAHAAQGCSVIQGLILLPNILL